MTKVDARIELGRIEKLLRECDVVMQMTLDGKAHRIIGEAAMVRAAKLQARHEDLVILVTDRRG